MAILLECSGSITNTLTYNGYTVECTEPMTLVDSSSLPTNSDNSLSVSDPAVLSLLAAILGLLAIAWVFRIAISSILNR